MIEDAAYSRLWRYLDQVNKDATLIDPDRTALVEIIRDRQGGPAPKGAYAMVELLSDRDVGEVDDRCYQEETIGGEARVVLAQRRGVELLFRIAVYASRPVKDAQLFVTAVRSGDASVWLAPFVVRDVGSVTRAPHMAQENFEGRAHFDVTLGAIATDKLLVDVIEQGEIDLVGQGGADVINQVSFVKPPSP